MKEFLSMKLEKCNIIRPEMGFSLYCWDLREDILEIWGGEWRRGRLITIVDIEFKIFFERGSCLPKHEGGSTLAFIVGTVLAAKILDIGMQTYGAGISSGGEIFSRPPVYTSKSLFLCCFFWFFFLTRSYFG